MICTFAVLGNYTITKIFKHRVRQALVPLTRAPNPVRKEETTLIQTGSKVSLCVRGLCDPCLIFIIHFKLKFRSFQNSKFPSLNSFLPLAPIFFFIRLCSDQFSLLIVDAKIMANGYSSDNTSDEHCAGGSSGGLIRLQGDQVIHTGFPYYAQSLWLHLRITSSSICIIIYLILQIILNQEPRSPWLEASNLYELVSRRFCFQNGFGANFNYLLNLLNFTNQSAKPTDLKMIFFAF